ncbi:MAG: UDP-N-acetylglucosamine 1-carboxyvinyltransferase [Bdellovibrionales bacterium]
MDKMAVQGGAKLSGKVSASGSKNAVLPLLFATLLAEGDHVFENVPELVDVESACQLLNHLGCRTEFKNHTLKVKVGPQTEIEAPYDIVRKMRASILCLGPLLARRRRAKVSLPGGCAIGSRPIDLHIEGMRAMGADLVVESGYVIGETSKLRGTKMLFESPTVGGTENIMMAACLAEGETVIENAAKEPEIVDLADYLTKMGAKIQGAGTSIIRIQGVDRLKAAEHQVIPDRIEAGTLLIAGAITGGEVTVANCNPDHLEALLAKMRESGFEISTTKTEMTVHACKGWKGVDVTTAPHPAFPTDLQAQFMSLMCEANGTSVITETVFENRFMHVQELVRLNADITPKTRVAVVRGTPGKLTGAPVMATDLRASACLVIAGLVAGGETVVNRIYHLDRGYEDMEGKLTSLGAKIRRISG